MTKLSKEKVDKIIYLYESNVLVNDIAKSVSCNPTTVSRIVKRNKCNLRSNKISIKESQEMIVAYKNGLSIKELSNKFQRTSSTIIEKLIVLGVYRKCKHYYTIDDDNFIKEHYPSGNWEALLNRFGDTSRSSVTSRACKLKIKSNHVARWTDEEIEIIKINYCTHSLNELEELLNFKRSKLAISTMARKVCDSTRIRTWSIEEENILINNYSIMSVDEIVPLLPNRSRNSIINHANKLKLKSQLSLTNRWSHEDGLFLVNNWKILSDNEMSIILNKSQRSIKTKRHALKLHRMNASQNNYESLSKYIRGNIQKWKIESMKSCNFKCVLTGDKNFHIHHTYNLNKILNNVMLKYQIAIKDKFKDYNPKELSFILEKFIEEQNKYGLGVCVKVELHKKFHSLYGQYDNTIEQWNHFAQLYKELKLD